MPTEKGETVELTEWHHTCAICRHQWTSVIEKPTHCPSTACRSRLWFDGTRKQRPRAETVRKLRARGEGER